MEARQGGEEPQAGERLSKLRTIDRSSLEPPYAQVARGLREHIMDGEYRAGDRLPSEAELCTLYGVSRMTVRRAVTLLAQDGVVYTENGRGTFVRAPELGAATFDLGSLRRLVDDAATTVRISEARIVPPSPRVCRKLAVDAGSHVVAIKRVLSSAGEPLADGVEAASLVHAHDQCCQYGVTALRDLLANAGKSGLKYGRLELHASTLRETEASYLGEEPGIAVWVIEHLFFDFENRPVSWGRFIGRSDRLDLSTTVGVPDVGQGASE
jgi:GntR family transcriptional regulator